MAQRACVLLLAISAVLPAPASADETTTLAKSLAKLRSEVETLSEQLGRKKTDAQGELQTFSRQKAEMSLELDREHMRLQKLRMAIAEKHKVVESQEAKSKALSPIFASTAGRVRSYIEQSLPFRTDERLAELKTIEEQVRTGLLPTQKGLERLWSLIEDELRMTRESGLYRQTVKLGADEHLADVVRVGMVMLFFRLSDGSVGAVRREKNAWTFKALQGQKQVEQVQALFDSFKKQVRVGYFDLPNMLGER